MQGEVENAVRMSELTYSVFKGFFFLVSYLLLFLSIFSNVNLSSFLLSCFMYVTGILFTFYDQVVKRTLSSDGVFKFVKKAYFILLCLDCVILLILVVILKFSAYGEKTGGVDIIIFKVVLTLVNSYAGAVNIYRHYKVTEEISAIANVPQKIHEKAIEDQKKAMDNEIIKRKVTYKQLANKASGSSNRRHRKG